MSLTNKPPILSPGELRLFLQKQLDLVTEGYRPIELYEPISYTFSLGGKRIRPILLLLACDMFGGNTEKAINPAIAVEIFHNFTLLHDDIMDNAPLRRGRETVYQKWNTNVAILSGDTMFALAYDYLSETDKEILPSLLSLFTRTARQVCEGQQYDMNFETDNDISINDYLEMIRLKTAVLLACSLKMGALLAKAPESASDMIYSFGQNLGMAFQLQDDLLDTFGDASVFGKSIGGDITSNKKTFLFLKAMESADLRTKNALEKLYSGNYNDTAGKINRVKDIFVSLNIEEKTNDLIDDYFRKALKDLTDIPVPDVKKAELLKLAYLLMKRNS